MLEERVKGIVLEVLGGVQVKLGQELKGITLEVMHTVMEFEIGSVASPELFGALL